ncbi:4-oxalocrotonate tautomerase family protein [Puteibacter caeruleilacunae]|nr:4-oxalocrotonate tautomerase family protein [Puteibacter caeruleilacunae]
MPVINFQGAKLSTDQKKELIQKFTEVTKDVTHSPDQFITVVIEEYPDENLGVGGKTVSEIKADRNK